jgi:muconate cycloisomerase
MSRSFAASTNKLVIDRIETFPVLYPVRGRFKFFEARHGQAAGRGAVLVRITASDGTIGWGQSVPIPRWSYETVETVISTIRRYLTPELIGCDPRDVKGIHQVMNAAIAPLFNRPTHLQSGVDLALLDLVGKLRQTPVSRTWSQKPEKRLTLSWTLNPRGLDEVEGLIAEGQRRGYRHFNIKVAPDLAVDIELARMVKRLVPEGFLWADANGGYEESVALSAAPKLAEAGLLCLNSRFQRIDWRDTPGSNGRGTSYFDG